MNLPRGENEGFYPRKGTIGTTSLDVQAAQRFTATVLLSPVTVLIF